jgi:hypothetical protein
MHISKYHTTQTPCSRLQVQCILRRGSEDARGSGLWVRKPPGTKLFVFSECCVLSGRSFYSELNSRPDTYGLWCVVVCDLESTTTRRQLPVFGRTDTSKKAAYKKINWRLNPGYPCTQRGS